LRGKQVLVALGGSAQESDERLWLVVG
jgi:hypothetical protein